MMPAVPVKNSPSGLSSESMNGALGRQWLARLEVEMFWPQLTRWSPSLPLQWQASLLLGVLGRHRFIKETG